MASTYAKRRGLHQGWLRRLTSRQDPVCPLVDQRGGWDRSSILQLGSGQRARASRGGCGPIAPSSRSGAASRSASAAHCLANGEEFRMCGRVLIAHGAVGGDGKDFAALRNHGADWNFAHSRRLPRP